MGVWQYLNKPVNVLVWTQSISGFAYLGTPSDFDPEKNNFPTPAQIKKDIQVMADRTRSIRTFSTLQGMQSVPEIAEKYGFKIMMGVDFKPIDDASIQIYSLSNSKNVADIKKRIESEPGVDRVYQRIRTELRSDIDQLNQEKIGRLIDITNKYQKNISGVLLSDNFLLGVNAAYNSSAYQKILIEDLKYELGSAIEDEHGQLNIKVQNEISGQLDGAANFLVNKIKEVKLKIQKTGIPIAVSEPWYIWLKYPNLVDSVDFIGVEILPYWDGVSLNVDDNISGEAAVAYVFKKYRELQARYPNKPIVITGVGWPSKGKAIRQAEPSLTGEYQFLNEFVTLANAENIQYYLLEAFDQPWKVEIEGEQGAYWGFFNGDRQPKFPQ